MKIYSGNGRRHAATARAQQIAVKIVHLETKTKKKERSSSKHF
jgi:hypothetical protein